MIKIYPFKLAFCFVLFFNSCGLLILSYFIALVLAVVTRLLLQLLFIYKTASASKQDHIT